MNVLGRKAYMKHLDKIYKQSDVSWFTPVELFKVILLSFILLNVIVNYIWENDVDYLLG